MKVFLRGGPEVPESIVTSGIAFLGMRGSGKTYGAGVLAEAMLGEGHQVVVVDRVGNWPSLRLNAAGTGPSKFGVYVFGGDHADLPVEPSHGRVLARALATTRASAIIDVSHWSRAKWTQFGADFAEELMAAKRRQRSPLHLIVEEAHGFVPQNFRSGDVARCVGAFEELTRLGRNRGIGFSLVSQRPQAINKEALIQAELVLAFQLLGKHERKAVYDWISENVRMADALLKDEVLSTLGVGEALGFAPRMGLAKRVKFRRKETFDGSRTPEGSDDAEAYEIGRLNLDEMREALEGVLVEAEENDPEMLKARIFALETRLGAADHRGPAIVEALERLAAFKGRVMQELEEIENILQAEAPLTMPAVGPRSEPVGQALGRIVGLGAAGTVEVHDPPPAPTNGEFKLKSGARRMLRWLYELDRRGLDAPARRELGLLASVAAGGTFSSYLSSLKQAGLVVEQAGSILLREEGREYARTLTDPIPLTREEFVESRSGGLKAGARRMRDAVLGAYPGGLTRKSLARQTNVAPGGTFSSYLSSLRRAGLVTERNGRVVASNILHGPIFPR